MKQDYYFKIECSRKLTGLEFWDLNEAIQFYLIDKKISNSRYEDEIGDVYSLPYSLHAAARDLLEALESCLGCTDMNLDELDDTTLEAIKQARAAIAKAKGEVW